jgi:ABC-type phosphate/phosphonate transport system substrate-binding protein
MSGVLVGAVAYDPKAVTIWEGIREFFRTRPLTIDFVLFSNYEAQVEALFRGWIDIAWNTNVAWVRTRARSKGTARALAMRDADVGFTTKLIARARSGILGPEDLRGKTLALGSRDSAQAAILPVYWLSQAGLAEGRDYRTLRFDLDVGKHGDTGTSELEVLKAVVEGRAEAGAIGSATWAMLLATGGVDRKAFEAVWTSPRYCHCNFTTLTLDAERSKQFTEGLLAMDYGDPRWSTLMDLEGLKSWVVGRSEGYEALESSLAEQGLLG